MNRTAILFTGFTLAALLLFGVIFRLGVLAALPKSEWTDIGLMADFPPSDQPPVKIENDQLWIDLSQTVFETAVPKGKY